MNVKQIIYPGWKLKVLLMAGSFAGGLAYAAALPPLNWEFLTFISLIPLLLSAMHLRWYWRLLAGWLWGWGWSIFAYWFLREIHPAVPWMMAPVISVWPAVYVLLLGYFARMIFDKEKLDTFAIRNFPAWRIAGYAFAGAALFTLLEATRYHLFVWNDLSVTVWRMPVFMQIARITGRYGVSFLITSVNGALFALLFFRKRLLPAGVLLIFPVIALVYGAYRLDTQDEFREKVVWKCALIQGNLPQQRTASLRDVIDSINIYCSLSGSVRHLEPQTIIWPECAIPVSYRLAGQLGEFFRNRVRQLDCQMLIGSLDSVAGNSHAMTNSALLIEKDGKVSGKYDKFHRVPFGEYVPFREYLPESWIKAFDMGRDLTAGNKFNFLPVSDGIRVGTAVCYEGVFSYVTNGFAREGANVLAAVSNDVWYPQSSEPEQHLANAVLRCVETGLPMVRCGNNGGSGVVTDRGVFTGYIGSRADRPELLREQAAGIVEVAVEKHPELTPAVRFENWFVWMLLIILAGEVCGIRLHKSREK